MWYAVLVLHKITIPLCKSTLSTKEKKIKPGNHSKHSLGKIIVSKNQGAKHLLAPLAKTGDGRIKLIISGKVSCNYKFDQTIQQSSEVKFVEKYQS